jgi:hypothetical protein
MYLASLLIFLGAALSVGAWKALRKPLPQHTSRTGPTAYQRLTVVFLAAGIIMLLAGIASAAAIDAGLFSHTEDPAAGSCSTTSYG